MSLTPVLAALAGASAVGATWEGLGALQAVPARGGLRRVLAPLVGAGEASVVERRRLVVVLAATMLVGGALLVGPLLGAVLAVLAPALVGGLLRARRERWRDALAGGAPLVARSLADALAGGHSTRGAIAEAARAGGTGRASDAELRAAARALALGAPNEDVLVELRRRAGSPSWEVLVAAVLLQREAGGDLARLLRTIAADLEEARRVQAEARAASAQARFTAWLVAGLPLGAGVLAELGRPGTLAEVLGKPVPATMLVVAVVLEATAALLVRRLGQPREVGP